ncbi:MAG: hypothetical protein ATN35_06770 [Epulopiscium sp. Nele67-Bin004]|nr:MAG: hypothetical protein ATN35_06770 [Epulopiscium sp. Nele67-Bin004]
MRKYIDAKYLKIALYASLVVVISILAYRLSSSTDNFMPKIYAQIGWFIDMLLPVIIGFVIAYLMNPSMNFFERHLVSRMNPRVPADYKRIRKMSIAIVYFIFFGAIILFIRFLIPQLADNVLFFTDNAQKYITNITIALANLETYIYDNLTAIPPDAVDQAFDMVTQAFESINFNAILDMAFGSLNTIVTTVISSTVSVIGVVFDGIISLIVSIYVLGQKETFANGSKRLIYAIFKIDRAEKIIGICKESHTMMIKFFVGKSIDSLIIGILCFIGLWLMNNPYALLLSLMMGVCNMIPYFGPFIGGVPAVIITLFEGIMPAVFVAIFIIVLQQFDGLYLGPKILGDSLGITPFWIISSVTIGGGIAGAFGMFVACPIAAVIIIVTNRWIDRKLTTHGVDLPKLEVADIEIKPQPPFNKL